MTKSDKRELIIQAAIKVFAKEGFHGAKISDIANTAGIGKGTIYEYFESKTQLFEEMIKHTLEIYMNNTGSALKDRSSTKDRLKTFVALSIEVTKKHVDIGRLYAQETSVVGENIINIMLATQKRVLEMVESVLQEGIDKGEFRTINTRIAALSFMGSLKHMNMYYIFIYKRSMDENEIDSFIDIFMKGLMQ